MYYQHSDNDKMDNKDNRALCLIRSKKYEKSSVVIEF